MQPKNFYRYSLNNRFGLAYVQPLGESDLTLEWTREDDQKLDYKKEVPKKVIFTGEGYRRLRKLEKSVYRCEFTEITIEKNCGGTWAVWFVARISLNDGQWDEDRCTVEIKLNEIAPDQCLEDRKNEKLDLFYLVPFRKTVRLYKESLTIEKIDYTQQNTVLRSTDACIVPFDPYWGGTDLEKARGWVPYSNYSKETRSIIYDICDQTTKWARYTLTQPSGDPSPGAEWIIISDVGGVATYAKPAALYGSTTTTDIGSDYNAQLDESKILGDSDSITTVDNGIRLGDTLIAALFALCPGLTDFISDFFQINPANPSNINYVTGAPSTVSDLIIFQKSDVKRPNVSGNATKAEITIDELLNALVYMFNVRWRILAGVFIIEHISFFTQNPGFDLTQPQYAKYLKNSRRYSYAAEKIPEREEFKFMEASDGDFAGLPIVYDGACVTKEGRQNIKTFAVDQFTTDIELCLSNPDPDSAKVDDRGFVIMATKYNGTEYEVLTEPPILSSGIKLNNPLSWAHLHRDYHRYYRPLKQGNMNGAPTTFLSVKPTKKGATVSIPLTCSDVFDPSEIITTFLGVGIVEKAAFNFKDCMLSLDLLYAADAGLFVNAFPTASNRIVYIEAATPDPVEIDVIATANDSDGTIENVEIVLPPTTGTATLTTDKKIRYIPGTPTAGDVDNITYRVFDDYGDPSPDALITILFT